MPLSNWSIFGTIFTAASILLVIDCLYVRRARRRRHSNLNARPQMDRDKWFEEMWLPLGLHRDSVAAIVEPLANALQCEFTAIRPSDSFSKQLSIRSISGLDVDDEMECFVENLLEKSVGETKFRLLEQHFHAVSTVEELVRRYQSLDQVP